LKWIILDFGTKTIKALRVSLDGQRMLVEDFAQFESQKDYFKGLGSPDVSAWAAATIGLNELDWLKPEEDITVLSALPSAYLETRYLKFPFKNQKQIEKVLPFEMESSIPFDIEEIQIRSMILEGDGVGVGKKESLVLAMAYRRELIKNFESELRKFEMSIPPFTTQNLALASLRQAITEYPVFGILEFGHSKTNFLVLQRAGGILASRTFWWGGKSIADAIGAELQIESAKAERIIVDMGENRAQLKSLDTTLVNFIVELRQTLKGIESSGLKLPKPFPIFYIGAPAKIPGFLNEVVESLRADVNIDFYPYPSERLFGRQLQGRENLGEIELALPALSIALSQMRTNRTRIPTFSETGFQFQQNLKKLKTGSFSLLRKVALLLIAPFIYGIVQLTLVSKEDRILMGGLNQLLKNSGFQFSPKDSTDDILKKMRKELAANRRKIEQLEEDRSSPLVILTQISKSIPPSTTVNVKDFKVTATRILMTAETLSAEMANQISGALKEKFPVLKMGAISNCTAKKDCKSFTIEIEREKS
jgi:Tfp pilus assembly PilM family ATPase/Tfp pilus assembly protein PilN